MTETVTTEPELLVAEAMGADQLRERVREVGLSCDEESDVLGVTNMDSTWSCDQYTVLYTWPDETTTAQGLPMFILSMQSVSAEEEFPVELLIGPNWALYTPQPDGLDDAHRELGGLAFTLDGETDPDTLVGQIGGSDIGSDAEGEETEEAPGSVTEVGQGVWTVGRDIAPGTYRPTEPVGDDCYWAVLVSGTNGDDIVSNDIPGGGFPVVTVVEGQDLELSRCGTWELQE